jgi:hypothetical protein
MPPLKGLYLDDTIYVYDGSANVGKQIVIGGNVVAGLKSATVTDCVTVSWVPTTNFLGGTLAIGTALTIGTPIVDVSAVVTGPRGNQRTIAVHDSALVAGDPTVSAALGWNTGNVSLQASATVNVPIGQYGNGGLANLSFHRWIGDASLAATWNEPNAGWDISGKAGLSFNGTDHATDYKSGTEFHLEGSVEKSLSAVFSVGLQGYYLKQLTGDSGSGARLGPFKGEVAAIGTTAALTVNMGRYPATLRGRAFKEFDVTNRLKGSAFFLELTLPIHMRQPTKAQS